MISVPSFPPGLSEHFDANGKKHSPTLQTVPLSSGKQIANVETTQAVQYVSWHRDVDKVIGRGVLGDSLHSRCTKSKRASRAMSGPDIRASSLNRTCLPWEGETQK
jgi:hypothetical protein